MAMYACYGRNSGRSTSLRFPFRCVGVKGGGLLVSLLLLSLAAIAPVPVLSATLSGVPCTAAGKQWDGGWQCPDTWGAYGASGTIFTTAGSGQHSMCMSYWIWYKSTSWDFSDGELFRSPVAVTDSTGANQYRPIWGTNHKDSLGPDGPDNWDRCSGGSEICDMMGWQAQAGPMDTAVPQFNVHLTESNGNPAACTGGSSISRWSGICTWPLMFPSGGQWRMITYCVASAGSTGTYGIGRTGRYIQVDNLSANTATVAAEGKAGVPNMPFSTALKITLCDGITNSAFDFVYDIDLAILDEVRVWFSPGVGAVAPLTIAQIDNGFLYNQWSSTLNAGTYAPAPIAYYPFRMPGDEGSSAFVYTAYNELAPKGDLTHSSHITRVGGTEESRVLYKFNAAFDASANCLPSWWVHGNTTWGGSIWGNGAAGLSPQYTVPNTGGTNTVMWPNYKATYGPVGPQYAPVGNADGIRINIKWDCDTAGTPSPVAGAYWAQDIGHGWPRPTTLQLDYPWVATCLGTNRCGGVHNIIMIPDPTTPGDYARQDSTNTAVAYTFEMPVCSLVVVCRVYGYSADAEATAANVVKVTVGNPFVCTTTTWTVTVSARAHSCALMTTTALPLQAPGGVAASYPITCAAGAGGSPSSGGAGVVGIRSLGDLPVTSLTPWCNIGEMIFSIAGMTYSITTVRSTSTMLTALDVKASNAATPTYASGEAIAWETAFSTAGIARASAAFVYWKQGKLDHLLTCDATGCASCACVTFTTKLNTDAVSTAYAANSNTLHSVVPSWSPAAFDTMVLSYYTPDGPYVVTVKRNGPQVTAANLLFQAPTTCPDTATYSKTNTFLSVTSSATLSITPVAPTLAIGALTTASLSASHVLSYTVNVPLCYTTVTFNLAGTWPWNNQGGVTSYTRTYQWNANGGSTVAVDPFVTATSTAINMATLPTTVNILFIDSNDGTYSFTLTRAATFSVSTFGYNTHASYGTSPVSLGNPTPNFVQGTYPGSGHVFSTPLTAKTTAFLFTASVTGAGATAEYAFGSAPATRVAISNGINTVPIGTSSGTPSLYLISSLDGPYLFKFTRYADSVSSITLVGLRYDYGISGVAEEEAISWTYVAAKNAPVAANINVPFRVGAIRVKVTFACGGFSMPCASLLFAWNGGTAASPGAGTSYVASSPSLVTNIPTSFTFISSNDGQWTWTFTRAVPLVANANIQSRLTDNTLSAANTIVGAAIAPAFTELGATTNTPCNFTITVPYINSAIQMSFNVATGQTLTFGPLAAPVAFTAATNAYMTGSTAWWPLTEPGPGVATVTQFLLVGTFDGRRLFTVVRDAAAVTALTLSFKQADYLILGVPFPGTIYTTGWTLSFARGTFNYSVQVPFTHQLAAVKFSGPATSAGLWQTCFGTCAGTQSDTGVTAGSGSWSSYLTVGATATAFRLHVPYDGQYVITVARGAGNTTIVWQLSPTSGRGLPLWVDIPAASFVDPYFPVLPPNSQPYTVNVGYAQSAIRAKITFGESPDGSSTIYVGTGFARDGADSTGTADGNYPAAGATLPLNVGQNDMHVENDDEGLYLFRFIRASTWNVQTIVVQGLAQDGSGAINSPSAPTWSAAFVPGTLTYAISVPSGLSFVRVQVSVTSSSDTVLSQNHTSALWRTVASAVWSDWLPVDYSAAHTYRVESAWDGEYVLTFNRQVPDITDAQIRLLDSASTVLSGVNLQQTPVSPWHGSLPANPTMTYAITWVPAFTVAGKIPYVWQTVELAVTSTLPDAGLTWSVVGAAPIAVGGFGGPSLPLVVGENTVMIWSHYDGRYNITLTRDSPVLGSLVMQARPHQALYYALVKNIDSLLDPVWTANKGPIETHTLTVNFNTGALLMTLSFSSAQNPVILRVLSPLADLALTSGSAAVRTLQVPTGSTSVLTALRVIHTYDGTYTIDVTRLPTVLANLRLQFTTLLGESFLAGSPEAALTFTPGSAAVTTYSKTVSNKFDTVSFCVTRRGTVNANFNVTLNGLYHVPTNRAYVQTTSGAEVCPAALASFPLSTSSVNIFRVWVEEDGMYTVQITRSLPDITETSVQLWDAINNLNVTLGESPNMIRTPALWQTGGMQYAYTLSWTTAATVNIPFVYRTVRLAVWSQSSDATIQWQVVGQSLTAITPDGSLPLDNFAATGFNLATGTNTIRIRSNLDGYYDITLIRDVPKLGACVAKGEPWQATYASQLYVVTGLMTPNWVANSSPDQPHPMTVDYNCAAIWFAFAYPPTTPEPLPTMYLQGQDHLTGGANLGPSTPTRIAVAGSIAGSTVTQVRVWHPADGFYSIDVTRVHPLLLNLRAQLRSRQMDVYMQTDPLLSDLSFVVGTFAYSFSVPSKIDTISWCVTRRAGLDAHINMTLNGQTTLPLYSRVYVLPSTVEACPTELATFPLASGLNTFIMLVTEDGAYTLSVTRSAPAVTAIDVMTYTRTYEGPLAPCRSLCDR